MNTPTKSFTFLRAVILATMLASPFCARAESGFSMMTARSAPQWARDGVVYEIFTRQFSATGDFNGITARLDDLKNLGVNILWLMPIHPNGEKLKKGTFGSPYAVRDFYAIDPNQGTTNDFKKLVTESHKRGMKVIIDLVANHTAWDSVMMSTPEFYKRDAAGKSRRPCRNGRMWQD